MAVEAVAMAFAFVTLRSIDLDWKMKTLRTLPAILSPALSFVVYTMVFRFIRMLDRKDQKTLERLRAERKAKLDELKELTNYYTTQQLIQRYDLDPAAKAAAASVLASKLGTDSGIKVTLGDELSSDQSSSKGNEIEKLQSSGLRNRKQSHSQNNANSTSTSTLQPMSEMLKDPLYAQNQIVVEHYRGPNPSDSGWIGRIATLLVGDDPSNSYALICGNCLKHNGLAKREDFPHIIYYCPQCHALNTPKQTMLESGMSSGISTTPVSVDGKTKGFSIADDVNTATKNGRKVSTAVAAH